MKKIISTILIIALLVSSKAFSEALNVLVLYPPAIATEYGAGLEGTIRNRIAWANAAFANSNINIQLNLIAHRAQSFSNDFEVSQALLKSLPDDPALTALRNTFKPDLTVYLTHGSDTTHGIGFFPRPPTSICSRLPTACRTEVNRESAFYGISVSCIECDSFVVAHEIGHNLGAGHGRVEPNFPNGYPIATNRGYGVTNVFADVMSYPWLYSPTTPTVQYFANPNVVACSGLACGTPTDDVASGATQVLATVKNYSSCYPSIQPTTSIGGHPNGPRVCGNNVCALPGSRGGCLRWE